MQQSVNAILRLLYLKNIVDRALLLVYKRFKLRENGIKNVSFPVDFILHPVFFVKNRSVHFVNRTIRHGNRSFRKISA